METRSIKNIKLSCEKKTKDIIVWFSEKLTSAVIREIILYCFYKKSLKFHWKANL